MKHILISRCKFSDEKLMLEYIKISKQFFVPSIKSQLNTDFTLGLIINDSHIEIVKNELGVEFIPFKDMLRFKEYAIENQITIQTRHDIDDWMSDDYIELIHNTYIENADEFNTFLIQSQPIKFICKTGTTQNLQYTPIKNSMHLTLCQVDVKYSIYEKEHSVMYQIADTVFSIPHGHTKWIIHDNNISVLRNKKINCNGKYKQN